MEELTKEQQLQEMANEIYPYLKNKIESTINSRLSEFDHRLTALEQKVNSWNTNIGNGNNNN